MRTEPSDLDAASPGSFAPIVARSRSIYEPVGPAAYDCVKVIVVRDGSAILFSEFGPRPELSCRGQDKGRVQTGTRAVTLVEGLNLAHLGSLRSTFVNLAPRLNTLVTRWKRGVYRVSQRPDSAPIRDSRGPVVRRIENLQTFLTASEVDRLVDDYRSGATVNELAERYGVHRATVSAHLNRRGTARRCPGLGVEEAAEAVKLHLGGVSMRSIAHSMGVDRKAVRRALVEASAISE